MILPMKLYGIIDGMEVHPMSRENKICKIVLAGAAAAAILGLSAAAEGRPTLSIEAGKPDENGIVTLTVSAENLDVIVYELGIRYNKEALVPADSETGAETTEFDGFAAQGFDEGMTYIGTELDAEKGCFIFTGFVSPGSKGEHTDGKIAHITEKTPLYTFNFKQISDADYGFAVASIYDGGAYIASFPDGAVIMNGTDDRCVGDVVIRYGDTEINGETAYYFYNETHPKNFTKEDRLRKTVYLTMGDYAAVVDGALKAIDGADHNVRPFAENGESYYPLRFLCESLGFTVGYDEATERATVARKDESVVEIDTVTGTVYGKAQTFENAAVLKNDRTMVTRDVLTKLLDLKLYETSSYSVVYDSLVEWDASRDAEKEALSAMQYVLMPFFRAFI